MATLQPAIPRKEYTDTIWAVTVEQSDAHKMERVEGEKHQIWWALFLELLSMLFLHKDDLMSNMFVQKSYILVTGKEAMSSRRYYLADISLKCETQ